MSNITRRQRESRAYGLVLTTGGFTIAAVVLIVLAVVGIGSMGLGILAAVIAWGVTVGALSHGTVVGITVFWVVLFGSLFLLSFLPDSFPSPNVLITNIRSVLRGNYDWTRVANIVGLFLVIAFAGAVVGLVGFGKKDV